MPDASDKVRNFMEKMFRIVPGYGGYAEKESRRNTDKLLRLHLAGQLDGVKSAFDRFISDMTKQKGHLELMSDASSVTKLLEKVIDRLKYAEYGYSGFFDSPKVLEPQLDALYQFDIDLSQSIMDLKNKVAQIKPDSSILKALLEDLRRFDDRLNARHEAITESQK
ncbi:MAG: hypothetical protein A2273_08015 [Candidatus Edwardsbacteria bacterium RifOxyA12_full_54_48]|uniref:Uncharacterized protein n=1 Tax=Candidatus Edwardsbacteria bacterium GWF2_54_11 TaxID=1817851 RepID=A0A1F5R788_9BACT|nr:MAG: hypothetical protein A2502_11495 [Candidatus Edwardsbacteria bacterium RifOxyC12_full_54_24]OGF08282.1 MAG: hypothetical protein A2273_08015 [Candidatus Edwardsbacteria bacterium RifOxyA12_full_54_48]OGF10332.1 MAG: hypothetical protein A2024_02260 [Candidatus Edwardsbacteria bacterium GWF2_54_11]OGF11579.1 MAG: hypothetical protein A3K15_04485 [Candidatus Edwardsbacteria bacterium GWE2_54_12]OGJ17175.1 MAG: hypothetical protein A2349_01375 [Candidatus Edwardsbacteria bacterium RifOxyB1